MNSSIARPPYRAPFRRDCAPTRHTCPRPVDPEELPGLGWVRIVDQGEENTYMETDDGATVYVKLHR